MTAGRNETQYFTTSAGLRLCYAEYGQPDGLPLFYFHGWPSSRIQARPIDGPAREAGFRVIAPDRPGMGRSDFVPGRKLRDWPPLVGEMAAGMGCERFFVMGVSGGGPYALACAHDLGDRVRATAVVCGAPPLREFPDRSQMLLPYRLLIATSPVAEWMVPPLIRVCGALAGRSLDGIPMRWIIRLVPEVDRKALRESEAFASFREGIRQEAGYVAVDGRIFLDDWGLDLAKIRQPITFWHGTVDRNIPISMAKTIAARIPSAETRWLDGEGHYTVPLKYAPDILKRLAEAG